MFLMEFLDFLKPLQNYVNANLDKTQMPMTSNEFYTERSEWK